MMWHVLPTPNKWPVYLFATATAFVSLGTAQAQAPPPPPGLPYETVVTALRLPRPVPDTPYTVTVLPRDEIARTPALGTDDLVRAVPSAGTFRRTPSLTADPTAQGLNLRGVGPSGVSRALVLLDGVPVNDSFGGWVYWRALPRLGLSQIEIAPGGSGALYGNYALAGTVQLISRPIENSLDADVGIGNLGTEMGAFRAARKNAKIGGSIEIETLRSNGYVPVSPYQRGLIDRAANSAHVAADGRLEFTPTLADRVSLRLRYFDEDENGGTLYTTASVRSLNYSSSYEHRGDQGGNWKATFFGSHDRFEQSRTRAGANRATEAQAATQLVPSNAQGASVVWTTAPLRAAGQHIVMAGVDARRVAGSTGETLFPAQRMPTTLVGRQGDGEQQFAGAFVQELYDPTAWLSVSAAARMDLWKNRATTRVDTRENGETDITALNGHHATEFSPRLGVLVKPSVNTRLRASGYQSFRAPTLNELYRPFQVGTTLTAANPDLNAEHLVGAELGAEYLLPHAGALRATGFMNWLDKPIVNETLAMPLPGGATRQRRNLGQARIRGVELAAELRPTRWLTAMGAYTLADNKVLESPGQPELVGRRLPQDPVHRGRASLTANAGRFLASVQARTQSHQYEDDKNTLLMKAYLLIDSFVSVGVGGDVEIYGSIQNIFDSKYLVGRAGLDTIGPPRLVLAGLRVHR